MTEDDGIDRICLDTALIHSGFLHKLVQAGGQIKFKKFPFGIKFISNGGPMLEIQLFTVREDVKFTTHATPSWKKAVPKKVVKESIEIKEDEKIVM